MDHQFPHCRYLRRMGKMQVGWKDSRISARKGIPTFKSPDIREPKDLSVRLLKESSL